MLVNLTCFHKANFDPAPTIGDLLWCYRCQDWREFLSSAEPITYRIRCRMCKYPRSFGSDKQAAFRAGIKHLIRQPKHVVRITCNGELVQELTDATEEIPGMPAIQEWLASNPQHQGSLRALTLSIQAKRTHPD